MFTLLALIFTHEVAAKAGKAEFASRTKRTRAQLTRRNIFPSRNIKTTFGNSR